MSLRLIANSDAAVTITVKVRNSSGVLVPYNISAATEISWILNTTRSETTPTLTLTKTGGDISFTGTGSDGQYTFDLTDTQTEDFTDTYWSRTIVTIAGKVYRSKWVEASVSL